jgi:predicted ATP-grasp superfamily ATP-dependent carboligase
MENRPELCDWLADRFTNNGNQKHFGPLKSPFVLAVFCKSNGINFPDIDTAPPTELGRSNVWLAKPLASTGGGNIRIGNTAGTSESTIESSTSWYWQRFIEGESFGSTFFASNGQCSLLGSAKQIVGDANLGVSSDSFLYCGSIGPIEFDESTNEQLKTIGEAIAEEFQLTGVFGVDWVLDLERKVWLIEVNPRIPASVECLELAGVVSSVAACHLGEAFQLEKSNGRVVAKAILYSDCDRDVAVSAGFSNELWRQRVGEIRTADIPVAGATIKRGGPVCTIIAIGSDASDAYEDAIRTASAIAERMKKLDAVPASS